MRELKWPTAECEKECKGLCGYCPVHEKARRDKKGGDWIIGPEPGHRGSNPREQPTVYMSTTFSEHPEIRSRDSGIQYGCGTMKTTVPYDQPFTHSNGRMTLPAIAGKGEVFGLTWDACWLLTVGGRCWRY